MTFESSAHPRGEHLRLRTRLTGGQLSSGLINGV
jgi:hypothetical protein